MALRPLAAAARLGGLCESGGVGVATTSGSLLLILLLLLLLAFLNLFRRALVGVWSIVVELVVVAPIVEQIIDAAAPCDDDRSL